MRFVRWLGYAVMGLIVLWIAGVVWLRMRGPDPAQQAALDTLAVPTPPVAGRDASDSLWLLEYDVPADKRAEAIAGLHHYHAQADALRAQGEAEQADALPDPLAAYPKFPSIEDSPALCALGDADCLAVVRRDPAATEALLQAHQHGLDAALAVTAHDGFRLGISPTLTSPIPSFNSQRRLVPTYFAHRFSADDPDTVLTGLCADLAGWRRIGADNDTLIGSMVGAAYAGHDVQQLAALVAQLPAGRPLPAQCTAALAPSAPNEYDLCPAVRGEFRMMRNISRAGMDPDHANRPSDWFLAMTLDPDHIEATLAPGFAFMCSDAARAAPREDRALVVPPELQAGCGRAEKVFDPVSCVIADLVVGTQFGKYADRRSDLAAKLALMRTALWLASTDADPWPRAQRLRERPAELGLRREATLSPDGRQLSIALL
jgi:hypothetical protein